MIGVILWFWYRILDFCSALNFTWLVLKFSNGWLPLFSNILSSLFPKYEFWYFFKEFLLGSKLVMRREGNCGRWAAASSGLGAGCNLHSANLGEKREERKPLPPCRKLAFPCGGECQLSYKNGSIDITLPPPPPPLCSRLGHTNGVLLIWR